MNKRGEEAEVSRTNLIFAISLSPLKAEKEGRQVI